MKYTDQEIINAVKLLQQVTPDEDFRNRMERKVQKLSPAGRFTMPLFALRVAVVVFALLLSSTGMVKIASTSKPGEALYPVKQLVDSVKTSFTADKYISKAPTVDIKQLREETPSATISPIQTLPTTTPTVEKQTLPAHDEKQISPQPTQIPTPTPTPTPKPIGGVSAVQNTVNPVIQTVPINVQIDSSAQPTPTPQPTNEGSKDNGSNAGAGGSLLPKIKIGL